MLVRVVRHQVHTYICRPCRHRSRKRRPFSRYAARRRINSTFRDKTLVGDDSKLLEEKLEQVSDLRAQLKCLLADNEEVKLNQEVLNTSMTAINHQLSLLADALEKLSGGGRAGLFRRVSRLSSSNNNNNVNNNNNNKQQRKASLEGIVKQLTSLAVSISTDEVRGKEAGACLTEQRLLDVDECRRGSGSSLPEYLATDKKLKRTNLMKRRESQALLEGLRKLRGASNTESGHNSNDNA